MEPIRIECECGGHTDDYGDGIVGSVHHVDCTEDIDDEDCDCCGDPDVDYVALSSDLIAFVEHLGYGAADFHKFTDQLYSDDYVEPGCEGTADNIIPLRKDWQVDSTQISVN